ENQQTPNFVSYDAVEPVTEHFPWRLNFGGDGLFNGGDARVARFDGRAAPIHSEFFQSLSQGLDRGGDLRGIMRAARSREFFVAEDQDGFSDGLKMGIGKRGLQQPGQGRGRFLNRST